MSALGEKDPEEMTAGHVCDIASSSYIDADTLRIIFPQWRIFEKSGLWWAMREGVEKFTGPQSLLHRVLVAADLAALAEKLCLQEYLDGLDLEELAAVYRDMLLPGTAR